MIRLSDIIHRIPVQSLCAMIQVSFYSAFLSRIQCQTFQVPEQGCPWNCNNFQYKLYALIPVRACRYRFPAFYDLWHRTPPAWQE